jgi:hypothetical protein
VEHPRDLIGLAEQGRGDILGQVAEVTCSSRGSSTKAASRRSFSSTAVNRSRPSALMAPITEAFIDKIEGFAARHEVPLISFEKHQRKDDVMQEHLARLRGKEGVLFIGKAQEKAPVLLTLRFFAPREEFRHLSEQLVC